MSAEESQSPMIARLPAALRRLDPAVATSFACIVLLLLIGSIYNSEFLSLDYLLQQLKVASFLGAAAVFLLNRTTFGRAVYAIGNRERAAYLSGVATQRVVLTAFAISGGLSAFGGVLLAGYASRASQAMGDPYLLPSIAAVVLGGTSILGGRGTYLGTVAGVILITLLQSILSVMQMEESGRQVIYGVVIIAMLLLYGRERLYR